MRDKKIKSPVTKGVADVPVIMQMEALECGAACLAMISAFYEKWIPLERVRIDCGVSRDGSNAKNMLVAARSYGLVARGFRYEPEDLKRNGTFPCIIHWNFNHFVVLNGFKKNKAVINDPAKGTRSVSMEVLMNPTPESVWRLSRARHLLRKESPKAYLDSHFPD